MNAMQELPELRSRSYGARAENYGETIMAMMKGPAGATGAAGPTGPSGPPFPIAHLVQPWTGVELMDAFEEFKTDAVHVSYYPLTTDKPMPNNNKRLVQVIISDPNPNVPLDKSVLHMGTQTVTELSDQELFFELPINELLSKHNAERIKCLDKHQSKTSGRDVYLDPAKVRDLRMNVVTIAEL